MLFFADNTLYFMNQANRFWIYNILQHFDYFLWLLFLSVNYAIVVLNTLVFSYNTRLNEIKTFNIFYTLFALANYT